MNLVRRLAAYTREIGFALGRTASLRDGLRLIHRTATFHAHNAGWSVDDALLEVAVTIGAQAVPLRLRPTAGDLFVLYEVLMGECYVLPRSLCDPANVRTIIDCGANIGITSLYLAARYPAARIVAVEPLPANFELLRYNTRLFRQIVPVQACVAAEEGPPVSFSTDRPAWGNRIAESPTGFHSEVVTIRALAERFDMRSIDLLKVDIEGSERELFARGDFLPTVKNIIAELHPPYGNEGFRQDVERWGFQLLLPSRKLGTRMLVAIRDGRARREPPLADLLPGNGGP